MRRPVDPLDGARRFNGRWFATEVEYRAAAQVWAQRRCRWLALLARDGLDVEV